MPQIDPDERLLALLRGHSDAGAPTDDGERAAVRVGSIARDLRQAGEGVDDAGAAPDAPPDGWAQLAAELGLDGRADAGPAESAPADADREPADPVVGAPSTVVPLARPGRRSRPAGQYLLLAAASILAVVLVGAALLTNRSDRPQVVAEVALQPLEGDGSGRARIVRSSGGSSYLQLEERLGPLPAGSYAEVWLIDPESGLKRMVSLGVVDGSGRYTIPPGIDPATYRVVDISIEPADGVPTHSGHSVLRGTLPL